MALRYRKQLGAAIRARRDELGLTQADLAEAVEAWLRRHGYRNNDRKHFDAQNISRWERGTVAPKEENFEAVAAALKTTPSKLVAGIEREPKRKAPAADHADAPRGEEVTQQLAELRAAQQEMMDLLRRLEQRIPPPGSD